MGQPKVAEILISHGANVNLHSKSIDRAPLNFAAYRRDGATIVEALLKAGANVNHPDTNGLTSLHVAVENGPYKTPFAPNK